MHATQQQTFREPRMALAAVALAVAFSTGTVLGLAIGVSDPKFDTVTAAAPVGDRSYRGILDEGTSGPVSAPAAKTFQAPRSHGPLEFD